MTRAGVITLALLCSLLVSGGETLDPRGKDAAASGARGAPDGAAIAAHLGRLNASLSAEQRSRIARAVLRSSERHGLDPTLVVAVIAAESSARPWVRSSKGAIGLMQVMPHMHEPMDVAGSLTSIETNIEAGCAILADNIRRLGEDRGILAYFWGSQIRGVAYLERVEAARLAFQRQLSS